MIDDIPNDYNIDPKVLMNQDITKAGDLLPIDFRGALANGLRDVFDGFTNHFQIAHDSIQSFRVGRQGLLAETLGERLNLGDGLQDVLEIDFIIPGHTKLRKEWPGATVA